MMQTTDAKPVTHTPGPWRYTSTARVVMAGLGVRVATIRDCDESGANARLIAAAPDLLAACKGAVDHLRSFSQEDNTGAITAALEAVEAAIAKAEAR
jgi:hypothetical protein